MHNPRPRITVHSRHHVPHTTATTSGTIPVMRSIDDHGQLLLRATDILVPARLGGPLLRRVARDVVAPACHSLTYGDRVRATRLALPTDTVLCGTTAAWIHGVDQASAAQPVEVGARHGRRVRSVDGRTSRGRSFHPDDVQDSDWGLVTTPARTAYDLARDPVLLRSVPAVHPARGAVRGGGRAVRAGEGPSLVRSAPVRSQPARRRRSPSPSAGGRVTLGGTVRRPRPAHQINCSRPRAITILLDHIKVTKP